MEAYVGEIRIFGGNFAPVGWAFCDGQLLSISENELLFSLIGTTYGGDGQTNFALPDLRGRLPIHQGQSTSGTIYTLGERGGTESVTLSPTHLPPHSHPVMASPNSGDLGSPQDATWATKNQQYSADVNPSNTLHPQIIGSAGGGQPHDNMMPSLAVNYIICLSGLYPPQN